MIAISENTWFGTLSVLGVSKRRIIEPSLCFYKISFCTRLHVRSWNALLTSLRTQVKTLNKIPQPAYAFVHDISILTETVHRAKQSTLHSPKKTSPF